MDKFSWNCIYAGLWLGAIVTVVNFLDSGSILWGGAFLADSLAFAVVSVLKYKLTWGS